MTSGAIVREPPRIDAQQPLSVLVRHDSLAVARALYKAAVLNHPDRLVMLCDRARVLARSDRPET